MRSLEGGGVALCLVLEFGIGGDTGDEGICLVFSIWASWSQNTSAFFFLLTMTHDV